MVFAELRDEIARSHTKRRSVLANHFAGITEQIEFADDLFELREIQDVNRTGDPSLDDFILNEGMHDIALKMSRQELFSDAKLSVIEELINDSDVAMTYLYDIVVISLRTQLPYGRKIVAESNQINARGEYFVDVVDCKHDPFKLNAKDDALIELLSNGPSGVKKLSATPIELTNQIISGNEKLLRIIGIIFRTYKDDIKRRISSYKINVRELVKARGPQIDAYFRDKLKIKDKKVRHSIIGVIFYLAHCEQESGFFKRDPNSNYLDKLQERVTRIMQKKSSTAKRL